MCVPALLCRFRRRGRAGGSARGVLPLLMCPEEGWCVTPAVCCRLFAGSRVWGAQRAGQPGAERLPAERTLSPCTGTSPGAEHMVTEPAWDTDLSLLVHPSAPGAYHAVLSPLGLHTPDSGRCYSLCWRWPSSSCLPSLKESLHWILPSPPSRGRSCVYRCTYSVPQPSFLPLASTAQAREGERPSQSRPDPTP